MNVPPSLNEAQHVCYAGWYSVVPLLYHCLQVITPTPTQLVIDPTPFYTDPILKEASMNASGPMTTQPSLSHGAGPKDEAKDQDGAHNTGSQWTCPQY